MQNKISFVRVFRWRWVTQKGWTNTAQCPQPTYAEDAAALQSFLLMLDTASFVERYALYEWVQDTRQLFHGTNPLVLNPAGLVYRDDLFPMAYNPKMEFDPYTTVRRLTQQGDPGRTQTRAQSRSQDPARR